MTERQTDLTVSSPHPLSLSLPPQSFSPCCPTQRSLSADKQVQRLHLMTFSHCCSTLTLLSPPHTLSLSLPLSHWRFKATSQFMQLMFRNAFAMHFDTRIFILCLAFFLHLHSSPISLCLSSFLSHSLSLSLSPCLLFVLFLATVEIKVAKLALAQSKSRAKSRAKVTATAFGLPRGGGRGKGEVEVEVEEQRYVGAVRLEGVT